MGGWPFTLQEYGTQRVRCLTGSGDPVTVGANHPETVERRLIGLVLVSHSSLIATGLREMVAQVAGTEVPVADAGGTDDGRLGTSAPRITAAIRAGLDAGSDGVLVLLDLGSAGLSVELALEEFDADDRARIQVSEAPLVEGAILAAVQASIGASLAEVAEAAAGAAGMPKMPRD
jgi:dihydroxyacetone kinase phosphotransfer subunit